jgi:hypothetical protein
MHIIKQLSEDEFVINNIQVILLMIDNYDCK